MLYHQGEMYEFNFGELTRLVEVVRGNHYIPNKPEPIVDIHVTDSIGDLEHSYYDAMEHDDFKRYLQRQSEDARLYQG